MSENLNNYKVFYTVATLGNFSKAADALYVSQPAISKSINNLEDSLEVKLLNRSPKGITLTNEGQIIFDQIKIAFDAISKGEEELKKINKLGIGEIRIGVSTSLCKHILLDYLQDFIYENPHTKITIDCHSTVNTLKLLRNGEIDLGLICEAKLPAEFTYVPIKDIHDIFVCSNSYLENLTIREKGDNNEENEESDFFFAGNFTSILNNKQNNTTLSTREILEKSNLMLLEKNNITRTIIDAYLGELSIHPTQLIEINNMDLLIDFATIGMGVAAIVREFALSELESGQIFELPLDEPLAKRTVGFVYANDHANDKTLSEFLAMI